MEKGSTTWDEGIQLCWEVDGQNLREKNLGQNFRKSEICHFSSSLVSTSNLPCWLVEEFVVAEECAPCSNFQAVSISFLSLFPDTESDWDGVTV